MRYAIIDIQTNDVCNICEWDGNEETWSPMAGNKAVLDNDKPYQYVMPDAPEPPLRPHFAVPNTNIRLGIETSDRDAFNAQLALLTLAKSKGAMLEHDSVQFFDADGVTVHTVTLGQYENIMLQYGMYMLTLAFNQG